MPINEKALHKEKQLNAFTAFSFNFLSFWRTF